MTPEEQEKAGKLIEAELKFRAWVACGWGLVILFAMMGVILGNPKGVLIGIIAAVMWVLNRIIREAFDALRLLRGAKKLAEEEKKKDSGEPPGPLAGA